MENKLKHLEFIQNIISRMANNSFLIKGWVITIVSALFALAANGSNSKFVIISYIAIPIFWMLDGYFLSKERQFRKLYEEVTLITDDTTITFSMNTSLFNSGRNTWICSFFSKTLLFFYLTAVVITLAVKFLI